MGLAREPTAAAGSLSDASALGCEHRTTKARLRGMPQSRGTLRSGLEFSVQTRAHRHVAFFRKGLDVSNIDHPEYLAWLRLRDADLSLFNPRSKYDSQ
jgi:hypothetical protein